MTKASHAKKPAKSHKSASANRPRTAAKAAASKSAPAKKAPVKPAKAHAKPVKLAKPAAKAAAKTPPKPVKVEKLTKAQLAQKAKDEKLKAKTGKLDPKKADAAPLVVPPKPGSKIAPKKPGENETPGDADS
ncbi:MAG TPA: hypothetical protein VNY75_09645, partial [Rhizomicrobium sp.]|nr:hypothetical protein [Rhizomicrobium sp.]